MLTGLVPADHRQVDLFTNVPDERLIQLSTVVGRVTTDIAVRGYGWQERGTIRHGTINGSGDQNGPVQQAPYVSL